jgi:ABC-type dipeptide/oligopeptide/nickel transport system ATPase subunit
VETINLIAQQRLVDELSSRIEFTERSIRREKKELKRASRKVRRSQKAQMILQGVAQSVQQRAHDRIAKVVSSCLSAVFGEEAYEFKIHFERKRGRTEARLVFCRDDIEVDPLTASGGGTIDIAAFALRVVCLVLHRPRLRPILVLDEPMKNVSAEYQENVRTMMEDISQKMGVQIIQITHNSELATGKIIQL